MSGTLEAVYSTCHLRVLSIQYLSLCCRVNLALAYTELTEELGRVRNLAVKQSDLLRHVSQEPGRTSCHRYVLQSSLLRDGENQLESLWKNGFAECFVIFIPRRIERLSWPLDRHKRDKKKQCHSQCTFKGGNKPFNLLCAICT